MKIFALWLMVGVAGMLVGCSTGSGLALGAARAATNPEDVRLYVEPPARYEVIGLVEATSQAGGFRNAKMSYAVEELRVQAAELGANGVLIESTSTEPGGMVGGFAGNMMYGSYVPSKSASGKAIYVPGE